MSVRGPQPLPGDCPITWGVVIAHALAFLAAFVGVGPEWRGVLAFRAGDALPSPWTLLTYPVAAGDQVVPVLVGSFVLWMFGGSLERRWGAGRYAAFLALVTAAPAAALAVASYGLGTDVRLAGLWMPLSGVVFAWSVIHPRERILLYMVLPIEGRWLGVLTLVLVFFGVQPFPLGAFALAGCGVAGAFVRRPRRAASRRLRTPGPRPRATVPRIERAASASPIARWRRWQRKRKFIRMMEQSGLRDTDREE